MASIPTKKISDFKAALVGGGARPNLFEVAIPSFPTPITNDWQGLNDDLQFLCKAASLPASSMAEIPVPFRGRILKVAGDRTFADWTITIINDENFQLRTAFEKWMNLMSNLEDATGVTSPASYMVNAFVTQLGRGKKAHQSDQEYGESSDLRIYKLFSIFPTEVSAIDLSYETTDTVEQFDVTFQVQWFEIANSLQSGQGAGGSKVIKTPTAKAVSNSTFTKGP